MRKIHIKIVSLFIITSFISCDSQLDLAPTDILVEESVFSDIQTAESALADIYNKLFVAATGPTLVVADASVEYLGLQDNSSYHNYSGDNLSATDWQVENIWMRFYEVINVSNVFIDKIPIYGTYKEEIEKQHMAEAKFNRAYSYLMLLNYYGDGSLIGNFEGLGVPLQLTPYEGFTDADLLPRSTNGQIYDQIILDLNEAIVDLPVIHTDEIKTRARATKATAYALLSRVYLYKRDYQNCVDAANQMLTYPIYNLDPDLLNLFPSNPSGTTSFFSDEVIFGFPVSSNNGNFQFGTHSIYYRNKYQWADADFINSMDPNDKRRTKLIYQGNPLITNPITKFEKTTFKFNNPDQRDDIHVIRLAEILLNKAEALAQLNGVNIESITILNQIKERSGISLVDMSDFNSKEELLEELHQERYIETAFEGRGRFDFLRTDRNLRNPNQSENKKVFPIPQHDIDLSQGILVQNPGYLN